MTTYFKHERSEMLRFLPVRYDRVLEVGCAEGSFSAALPLDCERWGTELAAAAAAKAAEKLHRVLTGPYHETCDQLPDRYFDLVICNDVIEHMVDHDAFLASIHDKMTDRSHLIGSIPNVMHFKTLYRLFIEKDWVYEDEGVTDRTHLRFFTRRSLLRTLGQHGYTIEEFHGLNSSLIPPTSLRGLARNIFLGALIAGSLGYYADTRFLQFGFRASYRRMI